MRKLLLSLFLIFQLTACSSIDKTLYTLSDSVTDVDRITGERSANLTSRATQIQKSDQAAQQALNNDYLSKGKKIDADLDKKEFSRLEKIFKKVHSVSHMSDEDWTVHLVPEDSFNAYVMGGTYVIVHKGLMDKATDAELAAVIGHEIAHVAANHIYENNAHNTLASIANSKSAKRGGFQAAFTHKDEEEADEVGTLYATLAGYDPYAASNLWKKMYEESGDFSAMIVDHPINSQRYKKCKELADIYKQYYTPNKINPDYSLILANNEVFGHGPEDMSQPAVGQGGGFLATLEAVTSGLSKHYEAKSEEARQKAHLTKIEWVKKSIQYTNLQLSDPKTVLVSANYNGLEAIQNLTILGAINNEQTTKRIEYTLNPKDYFEFELEFNSDVSASYKNIGFAITHVD